MRELRALARRPGDHVPHQLHAASRTWPETNCYLDLWIELLHALGRDPLPLLGVTLALDWEMDHFTFVKPSAADIFLLTGVTLHELAIWDDVEAHVVSQVEAGSFPLLEVDAYFLPDTQSNAYGHKHTKTTIAISALDPGRRWLEYFHNAGHFTLAGDNYDGVLGLAPHRPTLFPFAELARVSQAPPTEDRARGLAREMLTRHAQTRSPGNPIDRFAAALPGLLARVGPDPERINALCFNTTRQLGGAFGLVADHLDWLGLDGSDAVSLADTAKVLQFQIARVARRGKTDERVLIALDEMAKGWDRCMGSIDASRPTSSGSRLHGNAQPNHAVSWS